VFNNQCTKQIFGGYVNISEADIDWSDPSILQVVLDDMGRIYANATDNYAADQLVAGATVTQAFALADVAKPEVWSAEIAEAASTILSSSNGNLPTHLFVSPDRWRNLIALADTANRPLLLTATSPVAPPSLAMLRVTNCLNSKRAPCPSSHHPRFRAQSHSAVTSQR